MKISWTDLEEFTWEFLISCIMGNDLDRVRVIDKVKENKEEILNFLDKEQLKGYHFIDIQIKGNDMGRHINPMWYKAVMDKTFDKKNFTHQNKE